jgi:predicted Rossmann-fold nucleotide-binding protein
VEDRDDVIRLLGERTALSRVAIRDVDLRGISFAGVDFRDSLLLGCDLDPDVLGRAILGGAVVLPDLAAVPLTPYRGTLYRPADLYASLIEQGYAATPDAHAYRWASATRGDVLAELARHLHDLAMEDALAELIDGRRVVSIMGGHRSARNDDAYRTAATLGAAVARAGFVVATGGGPGAMEAANLGATIGGVADDDAIDRAVDQLLRTPSFGTTDETRGAWAAAGFEACESYAHGPLRSIGIPTWFYGHEPPNPCAQFHAKYFANALREDRLLRLATEAVIVTQGRAGTVQEVFQTAALIHYGDVDRGRPQLILVGTKEWGDDVPVMAALCALATEDRPGRWDDHVHLVDTVDEAVGLLRR